MPTELPKQYEPAGIEKRVFDRWLDAKAFAAFPDDNPHPYVIMMPLPNVTGALHMGHAMDNVMQSLLTRWHRMMGDKRVVDAGYRPRGIAIPGSGRETPSGTGRQAARPAVGRAGLEDELQWKDQYRTPCP